MSRRVCLCVGVINFYRSDAEWERINVDVQPRMLWDAASRSERPPDVVADVRSLPFYDGYADRVQLHDVLEHLDDPGATEALYELHRVIRPGGELDVQVPNIAAVAFRYARRRLDFDGLIQLLYGEHLGDRHGEPDFHRSGWSESKLASALVCCGFEPGDDLGARSVVARFRARRLD